MTRQLTEAQLAERAEYAKGLRRLAAAIETNPDVPLPDRGRDRKNPFLIQVTACIGVGQAEAVARFAAAVRGLGASDWAEDDDPPNEYRNYDVTGRLAGFWVEFYTGRERLRERRVVSREKVGDRVVETTETVEPSLESMLAGGETP